MGKHIFGKMTKRSWLVFIEWRVNQIAQLYIPLVLVNWKIRSGFVSLYFNFLGLYYYVGSLLFLGQSFFYDALRCWLLRFQCLVHTWTVTLVQVNFIGIFFFHILVILFFYILICIYFILKSFSWINKTTFSNNK